MNDLYDHPIYLQLQADMGAQFDRLHTAHMKVLTDERDATLATAERVMQDKPQSRRGDRA